MVKTIHTLTVRIKRKCVYEAEPLPGNNNLQVMQEKYLYAFSNHCRFLVGKSESPTQSKDELHHSSQVNSFDNCICSLQNKNKSYAVDSKTHLQ